MRSRPGGFRVPFFASLCCFWHLPNSLRIEEYLKSRGYCFAKVPLIEGQDHQQDRVVFNITEGPKVRVRNMGFASNSELASSARLLTQIESDIAQNDLIKLKMDRSANWIIEHHAVVFGPRQDCRESAW